MTARNVQYLVLNYAEKTHNNLQLSQHFDYTERYEIQKFKMEMGLSS